MPMPKKAPIPEDKYKVLYEGSTTLIEDEEVSGDELISEAFNSAVGDDGFDEPIVIRNDGQLCKVVITTTIVELTEEEIENQAAQLGMCVKHHSRDCEECD